MKYRLILITLLICMACAAGNTKSKNRKKIKTNSVAIEIDTVRSGEMRVE